MIYLKTPYQVRQLEKVNKIGAEFLQICYEYIKPGINTLELEDLARKFCEDNNVKSAFHNYNGFPHLLCVSIDDEVIHGFPNDRVIKNGQIVGVDFGLVKDGYFSDAAFTKMIGFVAQPTRYLVKVTEECLYNGIEKAQVGNRIHDIAWAIQHTALQAGLEVVQEYVGHAVGFELHEFPKIPNYVSIGVNWKLRPGMVIAIEPMIVEGNNKIYVRPNGWTVVTADHKNAAHFEHSIVILDDGPKILSKL
jgi:methionyl aminopeptidase